MNIMRSEMPVQPWWIGVTVVAALATTPVSAAPLPVVPAKANGLTPIELTDLVYALLPRRGEKLAPASIRRLPVILTTHGTDEVALVRVRVRGVRTMVLAPRRSEAAVMMEISPARWEATFSLTPGAPDNPCFGRNFIGCGFTESDVLKSRRLLWREICRDKDIGNNYTRVFRVTATGRGGMLVSYSISEGSGGGIEWLDFYNVEAQETACAPKRMP